MKCIFLTVLFLFTSSIVPAQSVSMRVKLNDGSSSEFPIKDIEKITFRDISNISFKDNLNLIKAFTLFQNYPNPFNPSTTIRYLLPSPSNVSIIIYSLNGKKVKKYFFESQNSGMHEIIWNGKDEKGKIVSSGIYFYQIQYNSLIHAKKMMFLK